MSTEWRRKTYYRPRVLISTARILDPQFDDVLLCLSGAQLEMLRNMTQYLHRRSTFSQNEDLQGYLSPTGEDWDTIQAIVSDLEEKLMSCEEFTQLFTDMLAQLECVCNTISANPGLSPGVQPIVDDYITDGVLIPGDIYGEDTEVSAERCAVAQLAYQQMYDILTIYLQPFQETSADVMLGVILAGLVVTVGFAGLAIPAATIVAVLLGLADMAVEGSLTAVRSAISSNKDELICALYRGLQTDYAAAQAEARVILDGIEVLTYVDKVIIGQLLAPWAIYLAAAAHGNETTWATSNVTAGVCADCDEVEGSGWWALRIPIEQGLQTFDHTAPGGYWLTECYTKTLLAGWALEGCVWSYRNKTGTCELKRMNEVGACITGSTLWGNHSSPGEDPGRFFAVSDVTIDVDACAAVLAPYATRQTDVWTYDDEEEVNITWQMGFDCVGEAETVVEWLVFSGSPP